MLKCPKCGHAAANDPAQGGAPGGLASLASSVRGGGTDPMASQHGHGAGDDDLGLMDEVLGEVPEVMGKGLAGKLAAGKKSRPSAVVIEITPTADEDVEVEDEDDDDEQPQHAGRRF